MSFSGRHKKFWTIVLLVFLLCVPMYGPAYFSESAGTDGTSRTGFVCVHEDTDTGHESRDDHRHIAHCHELDAPCDTTPPLVLDYPPVVATLIYSDKGALLPGFDTPIDIPPEQCG